MKRKPTGYVAVCQCGVVVGAMDKGRTASDDASRLLGRWLSSGCAVKPMFDHSWRAQIEQCQCDDEATQQPAQAAADARDALLTESARWEKSDHRLAVWEALRVLGSRMGVMVTCEDQYAALATHQQGGK